MLHKKLPHGLLPLGQAVLQALCVLGGHARWATTVARHDQRSQRALVVPPMPTSCVVLLHILAAQHGTHALALTGEATTAHPAYTLFPTLVKCVKDVFESRTQDFYICHPRMKGQPPCVRRGRRPPPVTCTKSRPSNDVPCVIRYNHLARA